MFSFTFQTFGSFIFIPECSYSKQTITIIRNHKSKIIVCFGRLCHQLLTLFWLGKNQILITTIIAESRSVTLTMKIYHGYHARVGVSQVHAIWSLPLAQLLNVAILIDCSHKLSTSTFINYL